MNRISQNPRLTAILLATLIVAAACHSGSTSNTASPADTKAADTATTPPKLPHMFVAKAVTQSEEAQFRAKYGMPITQPGAPLADSVFYSAAEFTQMVDYFTNTLPNVKYINVHFAVVDPSDSIGQHNAALANKMIYIFETIDNSNSVIHEFIVPLNGTFGSNCEIGATHAQACETYYSNTVVSRFIKLLDAADTYNYPGNSVNPNTFSNTMYAKYLLIEFQELTKEIAYQANTNSITISGFLHFFAAIPATAAAGTNGALSNRLESDLEFTQDVNGVHQIFYLESTPDFNNRQPQTALFASKTRALPIVQMLLDNGPLCPPSCP
jgi:hypothetical protein